MKIGSSQGPLNVVVYDFARSLFRWRLRNVLMTIAVLAAILGAECSRRRWTYARQMAGYHSVEEQGWQKLLDEGRELRNDDLGEYKAAMATGRIEEARTWSRRVAYWDERQKELSRRIRYHSMMASKFHLASQRPWESLPAKLPQPTVQWPGMPDPPEVQQ